MSLATEWPAIALAAGLAVFTAWVAPRAPERMPVHWDLRGVPDAFGSRAEALTWPLVVIVALYLVLAFAPSLSRQARDARFERAYHAFRHGIVALIALVHVLLASRAVGLRVPDAFPGALAVMLIALLLVRLVARVRAARRLPPTS